MDEPVGPGRTAVDDRGWSRTRGWVEEQVGGGHRVDAAEGLRGGWTSQMRRLRLGGAGASQWFVLRSFVKPFFVRHAEALLTREADILRLLADTDVPVARLKAVDATARQCDHPSLLMSLLPGRVRLDDEDAGLRTALLARRLVGIHQVRVPPGARPRVYQAWTAPDRVSLPAATGRMDLWQRAVDVIRREPPDYRPCFLHRDFHPGNVLFGGEGADTRITGVVDWVETSWGPADLDVAHCSTALALLHGTGEAMRLAEHYEAAGGVLSGDSSAHLYWRVLDALAFANTEKVALPWRELGRTDLTPALLTSRLEDYLHEVLRRFG
ncbi:phosphotransferase family protein [Streptomyces flavovirens]|uniref:phosphotransferase family protein n=1 Tax=Streptomyces TaxID=1883 RepID=UPI00081B5F99|nr:phosphotransferase [Streptomyces sp. BpilaLS-43]SCD84789.1 Predicted kinase, aminoglycoside phosphotransferase (APT) family [Streptomyces sp. BpilaLS-43]